MSENTKKRRVIKSEGREMVARVYHFLQNEYTFMKSINHDNCDLSPLAKILSRTAIATGVSEKTVSKILKEEKELESTGGKFISPMDKRRKRTGKFDFDSFNIDLIRVTIKNYEKDYKETPTLTKLKLILKNTVGFDGCSSSLSALLLKLGYKYQKVGNKRVLQEIKKKKKKVKAKEKGSENNDMQKEEEDETQGKELKVKDIQTERQDDTNDSEGLKHDAVKVNNTDIIKDEISIDDEIKIEQVWID